MAHVRRSPALLPVAALGHRISSLRWATLLAGLYYATQALAILIPGSAFTDPEFADRLPVGTGVTLNQLIPCATLPPPALGHPAAS